MTKTENKYRSEIAGVVHEGVRGMHKLGLADKKTMREFDLRCLTTVEDMTAKDILALREREGVSQAVFARCLNVTTNYISQLERGAKRPRGATLKPLSLIKSKGRCCRIALACKPMGRRESVEFLVRESA